MDNNQLKNLITDTFKDLRLSQDERYKLRDLNLSVEQLRYMRNCAFDLVYEKLATNSEENRATIKWLEQTIKTLDAAHTPSQTTVSAYFSPGNLCLDKIKTQFRLAKYCVDICVFTIADDDITESIIEAFERGVKIRIITDDEKAFDAGSDIDYLVAKGIPVKTDNSPNHMHHKFAIYDNKYLLNGSFNWTRSASQYNQENIIISDNETLVSAYNHVFDKLWKQFIKK